MSPLAPVLVLLRHALVASGLLLLLLAPARGEPLVVDDRAALPVWPALTLLADPTDAFDAEQLAGAPERFSAPLGTPGNLGRRDETVWLRVALEVPGTQPLRRVLEIDYPSLNQVDLYLVRDGRVAAHRTMGNALPLHARPLPSRSHAAPLDLAPGPAVLLLRVRTSSSLVLPITLRTPESFVAAESAVQMAQGAILGLAAFMLLYSLLHAVTLRDGLFLQYALLLTGNLVFIVSYFGIGAQYLWPDWPQVSMRVAPLGIMVAVAAGAAFMGGALAVGEISPGTARLLKACTGIALAGLAAALTGMLGYRASQTLVTVLGLTVTLGVLPVAFVRARRGEQVALLMLVGWAFYMVGAATMAGILRGHVEPTPWAQHVYPLSMMVEMATWMAVLGLRVQSIHRNADRARLEAAAQRTLAHTDALTGLPNRRGLHEQLAEALRRCSPQQVLAVYLLDLDGFKPINDRWGHDVGDALLVAVGQRLKTALRTSDIVARLGGDEFVVLAPGLPDEAAAQAVGRKLMATVDTPFDAAGQSCRVGLTIGYALAPQDGNGADELLKRADAAMYTGKQAGRRCLQRGGRAVALT